MSISSRRWSLVRLFVELSYRKMMTGGGEDAAVGRNAYRLRSGREMLLLGWKGWWDEIMSRVGKCREREKCD